jgi:hypothetical protein
LRLKTATVCTVLLSTILTAAIAQDVSPSPFTAPHFKRLQRDRERQTVRWLNFENRIEAVLDSSQRGFELALYYAVTHAAARGRESIAWLASHPCDPLQTPDALAWTNELLATLHTQIPACPPAPTPEAVIASLQNGAFLDPRALYLACERLIAVRVALHSDRRQSAPQFFSQLPIEFLLSLRPAQVEHPDWLTHIAALALIALDPNLESSQFLQAWAIEDRQMLHDGPGVAYEFLWADPYLPGVGYQNLDPWSYDPSGRLFARTNWDVNACWVSISTRGLEEQNCPPAWRVQPARFGRLNLIPMTHRCEDLPLLDSTQSTVLWHLEPGESVIYHDGKQQHSEQADAAGLLRLSANARGKVCRAR